MRIADDEADARQRRDFLGSALRITAGNQDLRIGIFAMNAPDGGPGILIGRCRYGASVENDDLGFVGGAGATQSALKQLPLDGGAVRLGGPASEILNVIGRHQLIIPSAMMRRSFTWRAEWV